MEWKVRELEAEVARLAAQLKEDHAAMRQLMDERDRLEESLYRARMLERSAVEACVSLRCERDEAVAEVKRLREGLERVVGRWSWTPWPVVNK